jgi:hypothetical protein
MKKIAEETHPITGRGVGYKLFTMKLIDSMDEMPKVYRALKVAREDGTIPWEWIIDETRELELISTWDDPRHCANGFFYRRDLWQTQEERVEVWSEKGTVRGVLWPVLAKLGVGFRVMHGFASATSVWDASNNGNDDRPMVALYIGDFDPSGMCCRNAICPNALPNMAEITSSSGASHLLPSIPERCHLFPSRIKRTISVTNGSNKPTAIAAGNWTPWTRANSATLSSLKSMR